MHYNDVEMGEEMVLAEIEAAYQAAAEAADAAGEPVPSFDAFLAGLPRPAAPVVAPAEHADDIPW